MVSRENLQCQIMVCRETQTPDALILDGLVEITNLIDFFLKYFTKKEEEMDKKMHKITEKMKVADKDLKKGKIATAGKVLRDAEKKNEKLVKEDKIVRDPLIAKAKKAGIK